MSGEIYVKVQISGLKPVIRAARTSGIADALREIPGVQVLDVLRNLGVIEIAPNEELDLDLLRIEKVESVERRGRSLTNEEQARKILGNALREIAELRVHLKPSFSGLLHDVTKVSVEDFIFDGKEGF